MTSQVLGLGLGLVGHGLGLGLVGHVLDSITVQYKMFTNQMNLFTEITGVCRQTPGPTPPPQDARRKFLSPPNLPLFHRR